MGPRTDEDAFSEEEIYLLHLPGTEKASPVILDRSLVCLRYPVHDSLVFLCLLIEILSGE